MPQPPRFVFVYGTLRRGQSNDINRLMPAPRFVCEAVLAGELYDLGPYPGMRLIGDDLVRGEIYEIAPEVERRLDEIEEVHPQATGEYAKREVSVRTASGELACLVYEIHPSRVQGRARIAHGDWVQRK
ncbi:MAG: gamma-glutamylcyclotransferase [Burkholderiales bacterium]|nr:gamma-glutamylcyclotransferase [Burkholderiales bacterium]